jgi:hypothetical protein
MKNLWYLYFQGRGDGDEDVQRLLLTLELRITCWVEESCVGKV